MTACVLNKNGWDIDVFKLEFSVILAFSSVTTEAYSSLFFTRLQMAKKSDVWSIGCTVFEFATGEPPWKQEFGTAPFFFVIGQVGSLSLSLAR